MKFAKTLEASAAALPPTWHKYLVQYKYLKKCIHQIVDELANLSLGDFALEYVISGVPGHIKCVTRPIAQEITEVPNLHKTEMAVSLKNEELFFNLLSEEVAAIDKFLKVAGKQYEVSTEKLGMIVRCCASPYAKDLSIWRQLLRLYLDQEFQNLGNLTLEELLLLEVRLNEFESQVLHFVLPQMTCEQSQTGAQLLLELNRKMIIMARFCKLNKLATYKILKKHDKQTHAKALMPSTTLSFGAPFLDDKLVRGLLESLEFQVISLVPQVADHACPVCFELAWRPVILRCSHRFCLPCIKSMTSRHLLDCPICRSPDALSKPKIDGAMQNFLRLYFPDELTIPRADDGKRLDTRSALDSKKIVTVRSRRSERPARLFSSRESCDIM